MLRALALDLIHDLRSVRYQRLTMATLLIVGLCLWGPLFARNVIGTARPDTLLSIEKPLPHVEAEASFAADASLAIAPPAGPLVQTAMLPTEKFTSLATLTDATEGVSNVVVTPVAAEPDSRDALRLESTIIGMQRRAAVMNGRMYLEGADVHIDGETFRLVHIEPKRILLRGAQRELVLTISAAAR